MDLETRLRRLELQLAAFEKLHTNELKDLEEKLKGLRQLQADEVRFLRDELAELKQAVAAWAAEAAVAPSSPTAVPSHTGDARAQVQEGEANP